MFSPVDTPVAHAPGSPSHSSGDEFDLDDDSATHVESATWPSQEHPSSTGTSPTASQLPRSAAPMQKRRRVTRACDECRRKKIKCDGKQPCTHCTVYSYECSYDQPSNRRRNPAPQYIEALENRLQRAEALLRTFMPNVDINDPNFDSILQQRQASIGAESVTAELSQGSVSEKLPTDTVHDAKIRSMIETTGQLDLDERGYWDFHGGSSGTVFLKRMREQFGGLLGNDTTVFMPKTPSHSVIYGPLLDSPHSFSDSPFESGLPNVMDLPSRDIAKALCQNSLNKAGALLRFVHIPSFYEMFDRIYDTPVETFGNEENRYLPLLYVVLALGCMFIDDASDTHVPIEGGYQAGMDQGFKYFRAARQMMDITDCRDITSLQAILFMILFLQSSSNLSTCYSYIGVALRSALRMGLHRKVSSNFNPIERETRRRAFWVIRKMDTYVGALLGFPKMLSDDDIDQELPVEVDDEYITKDAILPMPDGEISMYAACNAHTRLLGILAKVIQYIYPIKSVEQCVQGASKPTYVISNAKIRELEGDLQEWLDKLPMALRPGGEIPENICRVQQLLRMAYAHVQMMLYRPFLHYVSQKSSANKNIDERSYACAAACVSVSRNIVHITGEMKKRGLLVGAHWFTMYTTFFAILSLAFYVLENQDKPGAQEILADAHAGRATLKSLAKRSMAADRCSIALDGLFEQLPEKLKIGRRDPTTSKKRRSAPQIQLAVPRGVRSSPDLVNSPHLNPGSISQRAVTFPTPLENTPPRHTVSFDSPRYSTASMSESKLKQSLFELVSPPDISQVGTPDSNNTSTGLQTPFNFQGTFEDNNGLPDLNALMFPSADPFAYPNQPMMEFDSRQQKIELMGNLLDDTMPPNMFLSNGVSTNTVSSPYDNLEGQLFGPLPPYLMQLQSMEMQPMDYQSGIPGGLNSLDLNTNSGLGLNGALGFDEIFSSGNDEWNSMLSDQNVYRQ